MASLNRVEIIGNIGRCPEFKSFSNGGKWARMSVATSKEVKTKDGTMTNVTEWHNVVLNGKVAEMAEQLDMKKGQLVYISGELRTRAYVHNKTGENRYVTEIVAHNIILLTSANLQKKQDPEAEEDMPEGGWSDGLPY